MKAASIALSLASLGTLLSCTDPTTNEIEQLNLDRPVDIAFACWGPLRLDDGGSIVSSPQPLASCNIRSEHRVTDTMGVTEPEHRPPGQEDMPGQSLANVSWYGLILQSEPGTVAVARWDTKESALFQGGDVTVLDADRLTPGKNSISVGEDPVAIATDRIGCYAVTANAGSCDLSVINIDTVVRNAENFADAPDPTVQRIEVMDGSGRPVRAKPAAMTFEPASGTIGEACPAQPTGLAYIAYPSCHLVAGVDMATGTIVTGIQFDAAGVPSVIDPSNVVCNDECGPAAAATPGPRPVAVDLEHDERTGRAVLAIGSDNANAVTVYDLDPTTFQPLSLVPQVTLEDPSGKLGVTALSISPVIGMGGASGVVSDDGTPFQHQFIYAVATDGTVRVVDISGAPRECDTQIDPRFIHNVRDVDKLSCLPIGDPATPRRALAKGPGIRLRAGAVPTSVDFVIGNTPTSLGVAGAPGRLIGHFAIVTAASGDTYIVNVDNDDFADFEPQITGGGIAVPIPLAIAHQLRDAIPDRGLLATDEGKFVCDDPGPDPDSSQGNSGGPRAVGNPVLNIPTNSIAAEKSGGLPSIRQVRCVSEVVDPDTNTAQQLPVSEIAFSAPVDVRENVFPDLMGLSDEEIWTLTWEGSLSLDRADTAIDGPATRFGQLSVDALGMHLTDASRPFCDAGVEPNDILQLRGCDPSLGDAGCPIGYTCYVHPQSQVSGLGACMLANEAERLANTCSEYLRSFRRYTVSTTKTGELLLRPRKAELRTTPLDGCVDDAQCEMLADYALKTTSAANPVSDTTGADPKTYACQLDSDRAPKGTGGTGKRCLTTCETDTDCVSGTVCHADAMSPRGGYCMEGVIPPQSCVNGLQRYEVRAGEAFAVLGSRQGFIHPIVADAGGNCVRDPNANPYEVGRLPLSAPACPAGTDPRTGRLPDGTVAPNPCQTTVDETEFQLNYDQTNPSACKLADPDESLVTREAAAIEFRNRAMNLTIVDPTYQGDALCVGDRGGTLVNVPLVVPGYQIAFRQTAGFKPLLVPVKPTFPVKVVRGPQQSIWVMDAGDFLSTSLSVPSTRGKVFRVESSILSTISTLQ